MFRRAVIPANATVHLSVVIPAKAGIHLLPISFVPSPHLKIDNMDSRFRGNDAPQSSRFRGNDDRVMNSLYGVLATSLAWRYSAPFNAFHTIVATIFSPVTFGCTPSA